MWPDIQVFFNSATFAYDKGTLNPALWGLDMQVRMACVTSLHFVLVYIELDEAIRGLNSISPFIPAEILRVRW